MAISDASKVDLLWKKVAFGVSKTDSAAAKSGANETTASPMPVYASQIWAQADLIPSTPPGYTDGVLEFKGGVDRVQATKDATSTLNLTWKTGLTDWVPATFNANYSAKVYVGDPQTTGTQIFPDTNNEEFFFDYQAGLVTFLNAIPSGVATLGIYVVGYRYVGTKGIGLTEAGSATIIVADIAARDALTTKKSGDIVFVTNASGIPGDAGDGEYAIYMWSGSEFFLIATEDSAKTDAGTVAVTIDAESSAEVAIVRVGNGARIVSCTVDVMTAFDGDFELTVGIEGDADFIMSEMDHDVQSIGSYVINPTTQMTVNAETVVSVYTTGEATVGSAIVTVTYA